MTRKTKNILASLTLAASLAATSVSVGAFSDVSESHWAKEPIRALSAAGYINGYTDGSFGPDNKITRAEFVTIINNVKANTKISSKTFSDLSADAWYYNAINSAVAAGYIGGYDDGTVKPDANLTRAEAAVIAYRAWGLTPEGNVNFADSASIGDWASSQIATLVSKNIIGGYDDNTFRPNETITRAEVAKIVYRLIEMEKNIAKTTSTSPKPVSIGSVIISNGGSSTSSGSGSGGSGSGSNSSSKKDTLSKTEIKEAGAAADTFLDSDADEKDVINSLKDMVDINKSVNGGSKVTVKSDNVELYNVAINELEDFYKAIADEDDADDKNEAIKTAAEVTAVVVDVTNEVVKEAINLISSDEELTKEVLDKKVSEFRDILDEKLDDTKLSKSEVADVKAAAAAVYNDYYEKCLDLIEDAEEIEGTVTAGKIWELFNK